MPAVNCFPSSLAHHHHDCVCVCVCLCMQGKVVRVWEEGQCVMRKLSAMMRLREGFCVSVWMDTEEMATLPVLV